VSLLWIGAKAATVTKTHDNSIELTGLSVRTSGFLLGVSAVVFVLFHAAGLHFDAGYPLGEPFWSVGSLVLGIACLSLIWFDLREFRLPNLITLAMAAAGLLFTLAGQKPALSAVVIHALSGLAAYLGILALALASQKWFGRQGIGLGDGKLLAAIACWMGPLALPPVLLISSGTGILLSVLLQSTTLGGKLPRGGYLPFGPALCLAAWIVWNLSDLWPFMP